MRPIPAAVLAAFCSLAGLSAAASDWILERSELTYTVTHPLHTVRGSSRQARGKGICDAAGCRFLVAAPVKSFDSGDSNRDLHMLEATRGGKFPVVSVRGTLKRLPERADKAFEAEVSVEFAGRTAVYPRVRFEIVETSSATARVHGVLPCGLKEYEIKPPSLLWIPVKNGIPISVDTVWRLQETPTAAKPPN